MAESRWARSGNTKGESFDYSTKPPSMLPGRSQIVSILNLMPKSDSVSGLDVVGPFVCSEHVWPNASLPSALPLN